MKGTGFLDMMEEPPSPLPSWLTEEDVQVKLSLARQCGDEAKHFKLIAERMSALAIDITRLDPREGGYSKLFEYLKSLESTVERIVTFNRDLDEAVAGQSVTITLKDEIDVSRGDVLVAADAPAQVADRFDRAVLALVHLVERGPRDARRRQRASAVASRRLLLPSRSYNYLFIPEDS